VAADVAVKFAIDKQAHFWWGWAIAATVYQLGLLVAVLVAVTLGAAKEIWDANGHGTPDAKDALATAAGGLAGAIAGALVTSLVH
jgi:hypothetical protein